MPTTGPSGDFIAPLSWTRSSGCGFLVVRYTEARAPRVESLRCVSVVYVRVCVQDSCGCEAWDEEPMLWENQILVISDCAI